jgi:adenylate kinase
MRIVVIGLPASGKSTLTGALSSEDPPISTFGVRRFFAGEVAQGTALGRRVEPFVTANAWLPDDVVVGAFQAEIRARRVGDRFIVEGMPGNVRQAELLAKVLDEEGLPLHAAVHVDTPPDVCAERASGRRVCMTCDGGSHPVRVDTDGGCRRCGGPVSRRETDAVEAFRRRLAVQTPLLPPLVAFYRGSLLLTIDGKLPKDKMVLSCRAQLALRTGDAS